MSVRPYIIINGVSSESVGGLLVTELPLIVKPPKRVIEEEIDGKDGSIITELGYGAYDKSIGIALTSGFNIDQIIEYFNTSGTVTFSNEPDKYYRFTIYEQIDFEKLLRFKTAEVIFHCQPFKFSTTETPTTFNNPTTITLTNSGNTSSKPILEITGQGEVSISLNGSELFEITFSDEDYETYTIDTEQLNAYDESGTFVNRNIIGDYDNLRLNKGSNTLTVSGDCAKIVANKISRWL